MGILQKRVGFLMGAGTVSPEESMKNQLADMTLDDLLAKYEPGSSVFLHDSDTPVTIKGLQMIENEVVFKAMDQDRNDLTFKSEQIVCKARRRVLERLHL